MRRIMWMAAIIACVAGLLAGCGVKNAESVVRDLDKTVNGLDGYRAAGTMTLHTGAQPLQYQVEVWYKKPSYYRIALTNAKKDITQIVLRNDDGVFVLTPSLNKSFRFQSDWPQNQGQVYLFQTLAKSIILDNSRKFTADKGAYVFDVMANYQNGSLARQKIWLDQKTLAPQKVAVSDASATVMVEVAFSSFTFDGKFDAKAFDTAANMSGAGAGQGGGTGAAGGEGSGAANGAAGDEGSGDANGAAGDDGGGAANGAAGGDGSGAANGGESGDAGSADGAFTAMEPSYIPDGVALLGMSDITFGGGSAVMMKYEGAYDYTLIESRPRDRDTALMPGDVVDLGGTVGLLAGDEQKTLLWTDGGTEYRLTSGNLPESEMIRVAMSVDTEMGK